MLGGCFRAEVERTIVAIDVLGSYHQARAEGERRVTLARFPRKNLIRHETHVKDSLENEICFYEPFDQLGVIEIFRDHYHHSP